MGGLPLLAFHGNGPFQKQRTAELGFLALRAGLRKTAHIKHSMDGAERQRNEADARQKRPAGLYRRLLLYEQNNEMYAGLFDSGTHRPPLRKEEAGETRLF